jgi:hypothetical protein
LKLNIYTQAPQGCPQNNEKAANPGPGDGFFVVLSAGIQQARRKKHPSEKV